MGTDSLQKIGDIAEVFDGPHATPQKIEDGPYFLSISSLVNGQLDLAKSARLSDEQFVKWTRRVTPQEGDVLFSYETRLGEAALMPPNVKACLGRRMGLLRPNRDRVLPEYLLYAYLAPEFQEQIKRKTNHGATVERIALKELPDFDIRIPAIEEQSKVVKVLNNLSWKLKLNQQINQTLEQMAQAMFKSWFVDFDPVIDNALAAGNPIPDELQERAELRQRVITERATNPKLKPLPYDIHQLFPSGFEESELGWIPKGWAVCPMSEIVDIASSKRVFASDYVDEGVPFFRGKEITELSKGKKINTEIYISEDKYQELKEKAGVPKQGDILITSVGTIGNIYLVKADDKFYFKDGNLTWVRGYKKGFIPFYLKVWFESKHAKDAIERIKIGTTQQAITIKALNGIKLLCPNSTIAQLFEKQTASIFDKHDANIEQNDRLGKLRDTLLPKLISGQLKIPE
jgi:type I restriction enzyme S subunit